jgi:hypothetical protein
VTVHELTQKLQSYNPQAEIEVVVNNYARPFKIMHGGSEGCTAARCMDVAFVVGGEEEQVQ